VQASRQASPGEKNTTTGLNVSWSRLAVVFLMSYAVLLLGMSVRPLIYDEGLVLTAAMRVAAGQVPHRDFYANYGPAQFYILAGLFKILGPSVLIERLYDLLVKSVLVTSVYAILSLYCRKTIVGVTAIVIALWLFYLSDLAGTPVVPVSLLNVIGLGLLLPLFERRVSTWRMLIAGSLAGVAALFRYDTGIALLGIQAFVAAISIFLGGTSRRASLFVATYWPCLAGFALMTLPFAIYYLSVAPLHDLAYDIVLYPSKYYPHGRNLPFPRVSWKYLQNLAIYLPLVAVAFSLYVVIVRGKELRNQAAFHVQAVGQDQRWRGFLITFSLLALIMYFKGFVRIELAQMYLSIVPSILLTAVLFEHRAQLSRESRIATMVLAGLSVLAVAWATIHQVQNLYRRQLSVPGRILSSLKGTTPDIQTTWCRMKNPLTLGTCFVPDEDRIQAIEFIASHTVPNQRLYVGLAKHDIVFANDNLIYFAAQRLPVTKWSHFDPSLQNSYGIQEEMIREFERMPPPYIVLDSEFEDVKEPNDSSKSSGVTLLDDYIDRKYQDIQCFGDLCIWQRKAERSTL
jgi:hypothetical protein